jgi:hypothetical protein
MKPRLLAYELAVVTILCVLGIFFFPATAGPYSAVHGPVSGLLAIRAAMKLRWAMALVAAMASQLGLNMCFALLRPDQSSDTIFFSPPEYSAILRC